MQSASVVDGNRFFSPAAIARPLPQGFVGSSLTHRPRRHTLKLDLFQIERCCLHPLSVEDVVSFDHLSAELQDMCLYEAPPPQRRPLPPVGVRGDVDRQRCLHTASGPLRRVSVGTIAQHDSPVAASPKAGLSQPTSRCESRNDSRTSGCSKFEGTSNSPTKTISWPPLSPQGTSSSPTKTFPLPVPPTVGPPMAEISVHMKPLLRKSHSSKNKRHRVISSEEFPYPDILPLPPNDPHAADFRTRLLQLARLEKDTIHKDQERRLKRRHSIASTSPWTRLSSGLPLAGKLPDLHGDTSQELKCQARALHEAKELLQVLSRQPTAPSGYATKRLSTSGSDAATRSYSSLSGKKTQSTATKPSSLSRSKSCISLSSSVAANFSHQQSIRTHKAKRPQSATCRSSRRIRRHESKEYQGNANTPDDTPKS